MNRQTASNGHHAASSTTHSGAGGSTGAIAAGLRRWIDGHDRHVQAAVWLLLAHEVWPRRAEFLRAAVRRDPDGLWWIDFTDARTAFDAGDFDRAALPELDVLDLAICLGTDQFGFHAMGPANAELIAAAVAHAAGAPR